MSSRAAAATSPASAPTLADLLTARPSGLADLECWAILCQAVQALQDLFLSDGASSESCIPLVTPASLILSARGKVELCRSSALFGCGPPAHLAGYLAPEYRLNKHFTDTETEKMWIYALGETLKRVSRKKSNARLSPEFGHVLSEMTKIQAVSRASLMLLLEVISEYCTRREQNRPFSHIVMDLHQEAMAAVETAMDTPWGPPAMPELRPRTRNRCESNTEAIGTIPRRWISLTRSHDMPVPKLTKEASTSMEDVSFSLATNAPGSLVRPKSMCVPDSRYLDEFCGALGESKRLRGRRNPVHRAASRLYRASPAEEAADGGSCVGPEFVVRASLPPKQIVMPDFKGLMRKSIMVIMLNGQKVEVFCNANSTTAGQLFEAIIQKEHIEENFMLGLSALIAGDFVFLPSDTRICKAIQSCSPSNNASFTLFMRVRFFLPTLRGVRGLSARHLLYLQLRRSILEHQLPCSFSQLIELDGLALQAEFGDYSEKEHGARDYFLMEHYVPETMSCAVEDPNSLRQELIHSHISKRGLNTQKSEQDFIILSQSLPHYGGHFYTATWMLKDNNNRDIWLYISAQGINLYERDKSASNCGPQMYEIFEWKSIQTLCYSKHYLCILPHNNALHSSKLKKYKLRMDHKKSYFTFRLASLHHQFFLRLRTEYSSLQSLSQQFGIPLKDMKNETNSLCKLESLKNLSSYHILDQATINADTEFKIDFRGSSTKSGASSLSNYGSKRAISLADFGQIGREGAVFYDKENERPATTQKSALYMDHKRSDSGGLVLDSYCLSGLGDKRRGVKMGTRMFASLGTRASRSMEAVNGADYLEEMSLQSVSLHCSSDSVSRSPTGCSNEAYILESSIKSGGHQCLPDFQESLSETLLEKLNNISFAEERILSTLVIERDTNGSLGMQITEGSDGNVYVQSVILGGAAHLSGRVLSGDQLIGVDGHSLLGMKYQDALRMLTNTGRRVEFVLSRIAPTMHDFSRQLKNRANLSEMNESHLGRFKLESSLNKLKSGKRMGTSPVEKHVTENCRDLSNLGKYGDLSDTVPYHKHIRYEIEPEKEHFMYDKDISPVNSGLDRSVSKSCTDIYEKEPDKAVIVDMIPKNSKCCSLDRRVGKLGLISEGAEMRSISTIPPVALPRSLGLGRKWRGPVRYPVTPIKKIESEDVDCYNYLSNSDDEQAV